MRKKIALLIGGLMMMTSLAGCGLVNGEEESTKAPSRIENTEKKTEEKTETKTEDTEESTDFVEVEGAICGTYDDNNYINDFAGFKLAIDGETWKFYDSETIASATGVSEQELIDYWDGTKSPYDAQITYCVIAYNTATGSNIIVNYVSPKALRSPEITAKDYLEMAASSAEGAEVKTGSIAGIACSTFSIPQKVDAGYYQSIYAFDKDGLICLVTFTTMKDDNVADSLALFGSN